MTTYTSANEKAREALVNYLCDGSPPVGAAEALFAVADATVASSAVDEDAIAAELRRFATTQERGRQIRLLEAVTAPVARAILLAAVQREVEELPDATRTWISFNVTQKTNHGHLVRAIWRHAAGLGVAGDAALVENALKSALAGKTQGPASVAVPVDIPVPGTEDDMDHDRLAFDPVPIRKRLLEIFTFGIVRLPAPLRRLEGQNVYLDAVAQAVQLLRGTDDDEELVKWTGAVAGLMLLDGHYDPTDQRFFAHAQKAVAELSGSARESGRVQIDGHAHRMFAPLPDSTQRMSVYARTLDILRQNAGDKAPIYIEAYAHAGRRLSDRYEEHQGDGWKMAPIVRATYEGHLTDMASGGGGGGGIANVELPPLHDPAGYNDEIEPEHVRAVSTIYATYQLEFGLKAASRILDLFVAGLLPISASDGNARELDDLYWDQDDLLDENSRRSVYARVLGAPGGELAFDIQPNTEFNTLMMRVVSSVSEYEREQSVLTHFDNAGKGRRFQVTSGELVRKSIRDFAANASLRGWAGTAFTAERMARHVRRVMRILNLPSVRNAFGVTTPWQVIERVSQREFGITVNTVLHRTLAVETQRIMRIIADHHTVWSAGGSGRPLFSDDRTDGDLSFEATQELVIACQHFRAVTGLGDTMLDEYSRPVETQPQPSLPDMAAFGGMGATGIDMTGLGQLREMVGQGQAPSLDQLRAMLPGF